MVYPKTKICQNMFSPSGYFRCRGVCFFIRFGEMYHSITCSLMDALQWMGAVRMRVQTADQNHNNPHHSSPSVNILRKQKRCVFWSVQISHLIQTAKRTLISARSNGLKVPYIILHIYHDLNPKHVLSKKPVYCPLSSHREFMFYCTSRQAPFLFLNRSR